MADNANMSPREIEDDIERERDALGETLEEMNQRLSFDSMSRRVTDGLRDNGGEIARAVGDAVRQNPVALALTGVGLAWLMIGSTRDDSSYAGRRYGYGSGYDYDPYDLDPDDDYDPFDRSRLRGETYGASGRDLYERRSDDDDGPGFGDRIAGAGQAMRDRLRGASERARGAAASASERAHGAAEGASARAHAAGDRMHEAGDRMRESAGSRRDRMRDRMSATRESARRRGERVRTSASELRDRASHGLEGMSDAAKERVLRARHAAIDARERAQRLGSQGRERAVDLYDEQPLVAGALALAFGAALGAMLPRTDYEDEAFGEESDYLMDEAERVFREEREKLTRVASAAAEEARKVGDEAVEKVRSGEAVDAAESRARAAGQRVADAAREEAERQDLGGSARSAAEEAKDEAKKRTGGGGGSSSGSGSTQL